MSTTEQQTPQPAAETTQTETPPANETQTQSSATQATSASTDLGSEEQTQTTEASTDLGTEEAPAEEEADPYAELRGVPENDAYEFTLPDGAEPNEELRSEFVPILKELGLSSAGAQKLVDFKSKLDQAQLKNWGNHLTELKTQAVQAFGGEAGYRTELGFAKTALKQFGSPELMKVLNSYGVGAHAEMIRAFAKVGRQLGETPALNGGGSASGSDRPLHEIMYAESTAKT